MELLHKCFASQHGRGWWDDKVFLGLARLRGMECLARYAEAFGCTKSLIVHPARPSSPGRGLSGPDHQETWSPIISSIKTGPGLLS